MTTDELRARLEQNADIIRCLAALSESRISAYPEYGGLEERLAEEAQKNLANIMPLVATPQDLLGPPQKRVRTCVQTARNLGLVPFPDDVPPTTAELQKDGFVSKRLTGQSAPTTAPTARPLFNPLTSNTLAGGLKPTQGLPFQQQGMPSMPLGAASMAPRPQPSLLPQQPQPPQQPQLTSAMQQGLAQLLMQNPQIQQLAALLGGGALAAAGPMGLALGNALGNVTNAAQATSLPASGLGVGAMQQQQQQLHHASGSGMVSSAPIAAPLSVPQPRQMHQTLPHQQQQQHQHQAQAQAQLQASAAATANASTAAHATAAAAATMQSRPSSAAQSMATHLPMPQQLPVSSFAPALHQSASTAQGTAPPMGGGTTTLHQAQPMQLQPQITQPQQASSQQQYQPASHMSGASASAVPAPAGGVTAPPQIRPAGMPSLQPFGQPPAAATAALLHVPTPTATAPQQQQQQQAAPPQPHPLPVAPPQPGLGP